MNELWSINIEELKKRVQERALPLDPVEAELERVSQAAVTLLIGEGSSGPELLIIKRSEHPNDPWSGHLALPGGRAEPEDRQLLITAARETYEEVGLTLVPDESFVGRMEPLLPRNPRLPRIEIFPFIAFAPARSEFRFSGEVASAFWISLQELRIKGSSDSYNIPQGDSILRYPAYPSPGGPIWGITQRIISDFLRLIE